MGNWCGFKSLIKSDRAQGSVEYILLAGAIIVAAIIIIPFYREMARTVAKSAGESANLTANRTGAELSEEISRF
ncbi:class III signal peptide-containing protein [Candidatus Pyrohabitans sp.]